MASACWHTDLTKPALFDGPKETNSLPVAIDPIQDSPGWKARIKDRDLRGTRNYIDIPAGKRKL